MTMVPPHGRTLAVTAFATFVVSALATSTAAAQPTVAAARYEIIIGNDFYTTPGDYQYQNSTVSVRTQPVTVLTAHAASAGPQPRSLAYAQMFYNFAIFGAAGTRVPATFMASLFASVASPITDEVTGAASTFRLYSADGVGRFYDPAGRVVDGPSHDLRLLNPGTLRDDALDGFIVDANAEYQVSLLVAAAVERNNTADAYLDPVITIDPAYQSAYSLVLSAGISNRAATTTVPEPGTFALVGAGVFGVAGVVRRRRVLA